MQQRRAGWVGNVEDGNLHAPKAASALICIPADRQQMIFIEWLNVVGVSGNFQFTKQRRCCRRREINHE